MTGSVKESDLLTDGPESEIRNAIEFMGGYRKSSARINVYAFKRKHCVSMFMLQEWVQRGAIPAERGRAALVIESITGMHFRPEKLCPDVFEDWRTL